MVNKRLLLISRHYPPLDGIASLRLFSWSKYLQRAGYQVDVLTTDKRGQCVHPLDLHADGVQVAEVAYWDPLLALGYNKQKAVEDSSGEGLKLSKLKRFYQTRMTERMPGRTDHWILTGRKELKKRWNYGIRYDAIISSYGPPSCHALGCYAKKLFSVPWIADYRDLWVGNFVYSGLPFFSKIESWLEKRWVSQADLITTIGSGLAKTLKERFPTIGVEVIQNGFDEEIIPSPVQSREQEKVRLVYTGSIYERHELRPFLRALSCLKQDAVPGIENLVVDIYSTRTGPLPDLVKEYQLENIVHFHGGVDLQTSLQHQASATALLMFYNPEDARAGNLTGKLFEYLAAAPPLLIVGADDDSEVATIVNEAEAGIICGSDEEKIRTILQVLLTDKELHVKKNREIIERYSRRKQVDRLIHLIEQVY